MDEQDNTPKRPLKKDGEENTDDISFQTPTPDTPQKNAEHIDTQKMKKDAAAFGVAFDDQSGSADTLQPQTNSTAPKNTRQTLSPEDMQDEESDVVFEPASQTQQSDTNSQVDTPKTESNPIPPQTQPSQQAPEPTPSSYDPNAAVRNPPSETPDSGVNSQQQQEGQYKKSGADPEENIELPREKAGEKTHIPDPLFASRVLEQEKQPLPESQQPKEQKSTTPDTPPAAKSGGEQVTSAQKKRDIPIVRTYKGDVAQALKKNETSQVQMVLAEHQKREGQKEARSPKSKHNLPLLIGSIAFGVIGLTTLVGGAVYFYTSQERGPDPAETVQPDTILFSEEQKEIDITDKSPAAIRNAISIELSELDIRLDFVEHVYFTEYIPVSDRPSIEEDVVKNLVSTNRFFESVESRMPDTLQRALSPQFMYGIHSFNGNQPFIVLKTDFFENAFAGMLNWEPFMARDVLPLFNVPVTDEIRNKPLTDIVVKNRDLRALLGPNDEEIVLLYTFFDRETIIITTAEETLEEVIARLQRPAAQ